MQQNSLRAPQFRIRPWPCPISGVCAKIIILMFSMYICPIKSNYQTYKKKNMQKK